GPARVLGADCHAIPRGIQRQRLEVAGEFSGVGVQHLPRAARFPLCAGGASAVRGSLPRFSIPGGYFADRFSKRRVTIWTKLLELLTMGAATYALWQNRLGLAAVALFF